MATTLYLCVRVQRVSLAADVVRLGGRHFVWIVASFSATETFIQAVLSGLHGQVLDSAAWSAGCVTIFGLAALAETVKGIREA